jgi:iron complex outermembrane recepter protein
MRRLSLLIRVCMFTALSTFASGKLVAQQAPAASSSDTPELQEIVVTGSMIKRVNAETAEAVTVVKMDTLKDLGVTSVEQARSAGPSTAG